VDLADLSRTLDDAPSVRAGIELFWRDTLRQENTGGRSRTLIAALLAAGCAKQLRRNSFVVAL
jgi:hypothetical protein